MQDHISLAPRNDTADALLSAATATRPGLPMDLLQDIARRLQ
jgi:hypothetical protein